MYYSAWRLQILRQNPHPLPEDEIPHYLTVSCRPTSVGGVALRDMLWRCRRIPSFFIEGDLVDPRSYNLEQIKLQVGAFIETMERNKRDDQLKA